MRILQISSATDFGGGEKHLVDLSAGLQTLGHEIFVAARPNAVWRERLNFIPNENFLPAPLRNAVDLQSARRLAKFIEREQIEIVHAHLARDYPLAALAARFGGGRARLILTRHVLFPLNRFHRLTLKNATVIAVSNAVKNRLAAQKIFPPEKIRVIHNGINVEHWADGNRERLRREFRQKYRIADDDFLIVTVGELKFLKGQQDFVRAAAAVSNQFPNARFVIVGRDNSKTGEFQKDLQTAAAELKLSEKIIWLDRVADTAPVLRAADVFVSASHSESFGLAIVEAMASGCAVVAAATDGAREILTDGETGKLAPVAQPGKLANRINEFLLDEASRQVFGERAQKAAREKFDVRRMIAETEKIYREVLISA